MHKELRPVQEFGVDLLECFGIVGRKADLLPPLGGEVRALGGLDVEVEGTGGGVGADGGVAAVGERAGLAGAEAGYVVFVTAEVSRFSCCSGDKEINIFTVGEMY